MYYMGLKIILICKPFIFIVFKYLFFKFILFFSFLAFGLSCLKEYYRIIATTNIQQSQIIFDELECEAGFFGN